MNGFQLLTWLRLSSKARTYFTNSPRTHTIPNSIWPRPSRGQSHQPVEKQNTKKIFADARATSVIGLKSKASSRGMTSGSSEHVREYMQACFKRGLKARTVGHYLEPIRVTSRFLAANWPDHYRDICSAFRLPANSGKDRLYRGEDGNPVLSFREVLDFLGWLENYPRANVLIPAVLLQGICGLQLREALRLRWLDVNLETGTITIQDHPEHGERVKNEYRVRRIPMPLLVWERLESIQSKPGRVVAYEGDYKAFGKLLKYALLKWKPGCDIAPKDLRNTLQTHAMEHAIDEGWNKYLVDRYVGHAPETIAEKHYFGDKRSRMVDVFREHVSTKIDSLIREVQEAKGHKMAQPLSIVPFLEASGEK